METNRKPGNLRNAAVYIVKSFKFYDLKAEYLTPIVFVVMLFSGFIPYFVVSRINVETTSLSQLMDFYFYGLISMLIIYLASAVYLLACIREFKGENYSLSTCMITVLKRILHIFIATLLYGASIFFGAIFLIVPGIIAYLMFLFNISYIIDRKTKVLSAFKMSMNITNGNKMRIFSILLIFQFLNIMMLAVLMQGENELVINFISNFISTIILLMQQRATAMMYVDLEYGTNENEENMYD